MNASQSTRVAVVGLGSIGRRHARLLSERDDVTLTICDAVEAFRSETLATLHRPAALATAELPTALAAGQDAVIIATPNHTHVPIGLEALKAGADLLVEKPVSDTLAQAEILVSTAEKAGRFVQIGYMLRYDVGLQKLKAWIDDGSLGNIVSGRSMVGSYITLLNARSPDRITQPNTLIVDYTHEIDFVRWLFGEIKSVAAAGGSLGQLELKPTPNVFQMILRTASDALVQVHLDYVQFPQRRMLEVFGDRGTATYDFSTGEIRKFAFERDHRWASHDVPPIANRWDDLFRLEHASFLQTRRAGRSSVVSGRDGLVTLQLAEAAILAAANRTWIDTPGTNP